MRYLSFFAFAGLALLTSLALPAQTVRVIYVTGKADIQRPEESALRPAIKGETVIIGTRIVTGPDGRMVLTPMPGVKSIITPNTTLVLESVSETRTSDSTVTHAAVLDLKQGAIVSDLQKPDGITYDYSIRTARGLAGARGTNYTVGINPAGVQTIVVSHGNISLSLTDGRQISITPGQISITKTGGATQSINNVSELPASDKAVAQNWTEITVNAIAAAVESGELSPEALTLALEAAANLGITLSPATQATVDRVLALAAVKQGAADKEKGTDIQTVIEVVTETETTQSESPITGFPSYTAFLESLSQPQVNAMEEIRVLGFDSNEQITLEGKLQDGQFASNLKNVVDLYIDLTDDFSSSTELGELLQELGILGDGNVTAVDADIAGLKNLVLAFKYYELYYYPTPALRDEADFTASHDNNSLLQGATFFFPGQSGHSGDTLYNVTFDASTSGHDILVVGATRKLVIDNSGYVGDAFVATGGYPGVELIAADLIDLNNTRFASTVTSILMEAATINLTNINFSAGSYITLKSRDGGTADGATGSGYYPHFGSSAVGRVNFISNVRYDNLPLNNVSDYNTNGSYINIGTIGSGGGS